MVSTQQRFGNAQRALPERFGRNVALAHAGVLAVLIILALAAYLTLDRAIRVQQESATAIGFADRERTLSQRVASLTAQYALGNVALQSDLRSAIDAFQNTHRHVVAGDRSEGIRSVVADSPLKAIYFDASAPLDAAANVYVTEARRIAAMSPRDPLFTAHIAPVFLAAQRSLVDALDTAVRLRQDRTDGQLAFLRNVGAAIGACVLATLVAASLAVFRPMARRIVQLTRAADELAPLATTDPLTGTLNKDSFQARGAIEIQKARRYERPLSLLMIDADQFTAIENAYGPQGGETVMKALTSSFFAGTRASDLVGRTGTEQFAVLLPETNCQGAQVLAERLRRTVSELRVPIGNKLVSCTVSVGVAAAEKDAAFLSPTFHRAGEALYEAQMRGRNQVVVAAAA